jgi:hypothetical protein
MPEPKYMRQILDHEFRNLELWQEASERCKEAFIREVCKLDSLTSAQAENAFGWFVIGWESREDA